MYCHRQKRGVVEVIATILLSLIISQSTVMAVESRCDFTTSTASVEHARSLYDMQEYACALEELRVVVTGSSLSPVVKCEALFLESAVWYDSLYDGNAEELREKVLTVSNAAFRVCPNWNEPYDSGDKGYEILMIEARGRAIELAESEQHSLVVSAIPVQSTVIIDSSMWVSGVARIVDSGSHEIVVSHPSFGKFVDTIVVSCDTNVFYDLPSIMKASADKLLRDSIASADKLLRDSIASADKLLRDSIASADKLLRVSIPHAPTGARITLDLNGKTHRQSCSPFARFAVEPMPSQTKFTISFRKNKMDFVAKIDSVVFFPFTEEFRLTVVGFSAVIDFGRSEWKFVSPIDAIVYLDQSSL